MATALSVAMGGVIVFLNPCKKTTCKINRKWFFKCFSLNYPSSGLNWQPQITRFIPTPEIEFYSDQVWLWFAYPNYPVQNRK